MHRGKNYIESAKLIDRSKLYDAAEAFDVVIKASKAMFDETVEAIDNKTGKVTVSVVMFGRQTSLELDINNVEGI